MIICNLGGGGHAGRFICRTYLGYLFFDLKTTICVCCSLIEGRSRCGTLLLLWSGWCGTHVQLVLSGGDGELLRRCNACGEFLSLLPLLAPRALASNLVINSLLRRSGLFFIVLIDTLELCTLSFLLDLRILLLSVSLATFHVKDQVFRCISWLIHLGLLDLCSCCSNRRSSGIFSRLVLQHLTNSDCTAFVTKGEATELGNDIILLQGNRNASLNAAYDLRKTFSELWLLLFHTFLALLALLIRNKDFFYCALISNRVDMENTLITLWKDGLVRNKLKKIKLCLKDFWDRNLRLFAQANHITFIDSFFIFNVDSQLNVFTWFSIAHGLILAIVDSLNLGYHTTWHYLKLITKLDCAWLYLSKYYCTNYTFCFHLV